MLPGTKRWRGRDNDWTAKGYARLWKDSARMYCEGIFAALGGGIGKHGRDKLRAEPCWDGQLPQVLRSFIPDTTESTTGSTTGSGQSPGLRGVLRAI